MDVGHAAAADEFADLVPACEQANAVGYAFSHKNLPVGCGNLLPQVYPLV
jgi:hypothetical protein